MTDHPLAALRSLQRQDGAFASTIVTTTGRSLLDFNGFTAAIVLRLLRNVPSSPELNEITRLALDWLGACRSSRVPGAFAFWPEDAWPVWAPAVPADVDDTAIMLGELLRHGRLDRAAALRSIATAILPWRVRSAELAALPPWVAPGSFLTWIPAASPPGVPGKPAVNIVDCSVNANVVALFARLGAPHLLGYDAAVATVLAGLEWAGADAKRLATLTPFYPALSSLAEAVEHAVECGAEPLGEALCQLRSLLPEPLDSTPGLCRSAYGGMVWHAPAVDRARAIARAASVQRAS